MSGDIGYIDEDNFCISSEERGDLQNNVYYGRHTRNRANSYETSCC